MKKLQRSLLRAVAAACAALVMLTAPGVRAQGDDLDLEPGLEPPPAPPAQPAPAPDLTESAPRADEPGLAPGQDEPRGRRWSFVRRPPGKVRSPTIALILPVTLTLAPVIAGVALFAAEDEDIRHAGFAVMNTGILIGPSIDRKSVV